MEFLKCRNVRWKVPEKRNNVNVVATTAKHPDSCNQISRSGWMQTMYMRSVTFLGKFTSGSLISASRSDLLKLPINEPATVDTFKWHFTPAVPEWLY